jgi:2-polyprenyl-3-methyl-5-hydroxy-6-metoxy-1,4-benzoquinol methylase
MSTVRTQAGFAFKEVDPEGEETLEAMSQAPNFNRWMFETIRPYLAGPVLEVGSGIGNLSALLLEAGFPSLLSDVRPRYCQKLRETFAHHPCCKAVVQLDLVHPEFERAYASLLGQFGAVFALNVVEHIADEHRAVLNCRKLLRPEGNLILLVPAYELLYNRFDRELCHFRRYTRATLERLVAVNGLEVARSFYFNLGGTLGWFVSGTLLGHATPSPRLVGVYDRLVPLFRLLDRLTWRRLGLSVITVGRAAEAVARRRAA